MCGLPGAGKTTLAKKLQAERGATRLCPDEWMLAVMMDSSDVKERDRLRDPMEQALWKEGQELLKLGVNVILENGFWSKEEREIYRTIGKSLGAKVELHFLDAPFEVLWERVEKRNLNPQEFYITKKDMDDGWNVFQVPTEEEGRGYDFYKHYL